MWQDVIDTGARLFRLNPRDIPAGCKHRYCINARFAVCLALRERGASYSQIAARLRYRDHTSVIHAVGRARELADRDPEYRAKVQHMIGLNRT